MHISNNSQVVSGSNGSANVIVSPNYATSVTTPLTIMPGQRQQLGPDSAIGGLVDTFPINLFLVTPVSLPAECAEFQVAFAMQPYPGQVSP